MKINQSLLFFIFLQLIVHTNLINGNLLQDSQNQNSTLRSRTLQSNNPKNKKAQNCKSFDLIQQNTCLQCTDLFMLPDCSQCPIGFVNASQKCNKCGDYQSFCDSTDNNEYCYLGFTKNGSTCNCQQPKSIYKKWCTNLHDLIYDVFYDKGNIVCEFSTEVYLGSFSTELQFTPSFQNCILALVEQDDLLKYPNIQCYLDKQNQSLFYISLGKQDISLRLFSKIPKLNKLNYLIMKDKKASTSITFQPSQKKTDNQVVYYNKNDFTAKLCYFSQNNYYFLAGKQQYIIDLKLFTFQENYFTNSGPTFSILSSKNLKKPQQDQILKSFESSSYPINNAQLPSEIFSIEKTEITLSYICQYPFDLITSNIVTFKTVLSLDQSCPIQLLNVKPLIFSEQINLSFTCNFTDFSASPEDIFNVQYQVLDTENNQVINENINIRQSEFPKIISIPPNKLNQEQIYFFQVQSNYNQVHGAINQQELKDTRKIVEITIQGGDREKQDPKQELQIVGLINDGAFQGQDPSKFVYKWTCFDQVLQINCVDALQAPLQFLNDSKVKLPPNTLDYNGIYIFKLKVESQGNSKTVQVTIKTITLPLQVQFDSSYQNQHIQLDQTLKFQLIYQYSNYLRIFKCNHYYEYGYLDVLSTLSKGRKENNIFTKISDLIPQENFNQQLTFFMRFYVYDFHNNLVAVSRRIYFQTYAPPSNCQIQFVSPITGNEMAFVDKIKLRIVNCNSNNLSYQLFYYSEGDFDNKEKNLPSNIKAKYLSKFIPENTFETYLPAGQITLVVIVKDSVETKIQYTQTIAIKQNSFSQIDYENFLKQQNEKALQFENNSQFEEQLCTYGMIIECIENFENQNSNQAPSSSILQLKADMKSQFLQLSNKIPNNSFSQSLQEYNVRCLKRLYNTKDVPDQLNTRLNDIDQLVSETIKDMQQISPFVSQIRDTYKNKILISLDIVAQNIQDISKIIAQTPSVSWCDQQVKTVAQIQGALSLTLYANQERIIWDTPILSVSVQKIDELNLFKNYLLYDESKFDDKLFDQNVFYNVEIQSWKENIYAFEASFQDQYKSYLSQAKSAEQQAIFKQTYPAIYPRVVKSFSNDNSRFLLEDEEVLQLPAPINSQFNNLKGNTKIKCTQRINKIWTQSSCKTVITQTGDTFSASCVCSTPNFTSLMIDVESLFQNENIKDIFSESGIKGILSLDNWYQYSCIYVLIGINILSIIICIVGTRLDKADEEEDNIYQSSTYFASQVTIDHMARRRSFRPRATSITEKVLEQNRNQLYLQNNKTIELSENKTASNTPNENDGTKQTISQQKSSENTFKLSSNQITGVRFQNKARTYFQRKQSDSNNQIALSTEPNIKPEIDTNIKNTTCTETPVNKDEKEVFTQYRINFVESNNHTQHTCEGILIENNNRKMNKQTSIIKQLQTKQEMKQEKIQKKQQKQQRNQEVQVLSLEYLQSLSKIRGTCVFHNFLSIFCLYNYKKPRWLRFCIYYNQIIWLIAISSTFGSSLTIAQVLVLSFVVSIIFDIFKILIKFTLIKRSAKIVGYTLIFAFLVFCYYSILVNISNSTPSSSSKWIINFVIAEIFDIFFSGLILSLIKFQITLKLLPKFKITHFIYKITSADTLFGMFS